MRRAIVMLAVSGCVGTGVVSCPDGSLCPPDSVCHEVHRPITNELVGACVNQTQLDACEGIADGDACDPMRTGSERCYDGVCSEGGCGNGRLDDAEGCDDGNAVVGDGCASCRVEACGNGFVDPVIVGATGPEPNEACDDANLLGRDGCASDCQPETLGWSRVDVVPRPATLASMAFDPIRRRVVMWGGADVEFRSVENLDATWEWDGFGWSSVELRPAPTARRTPSLAFDGNTKTVVMFGGFLSNGLTTDQMWSYDGVEWRALAPASVPARRAEALMAYDAHRGRLVLIGGVDDQHAPIGDEWEWDGTSWTPTAMHFDDPPTALTYDPARARLVLVDALGRTFERREAGWTRAGDAPFVTPPRLVFEPSTQQVLAIEGGDEIAMYRWDGAMWTQARVTIEIPVSRVELAAIADPIRGQVVLYGGLHELACLECNRAYGDTWTWDGTTWTERTSRLPDLIAGTVAHDPTRNVVQIVDRSALEDKTALWELEDGHWTEYVTTDPPARTAPGLVHTRTQTIMFGGRDIDGRDDTWAWDGQTWTEIISATRPPARSDHAMAYDTHRDRIVVFGGSAFGGYFDDTWEFDGTTWIAMNPATKPSQRSGAHAVYDPVRRLVVLVGGYTFDGHVDDLWTYDGTSWNTYPIPPPDAGPEQRLIWNPSRGEVELLDVLRGSMSALVWTNGPRWVARDATSSPTRMLFGMAFPVGADVFLLGRVDSLSDNELWRRRWSHTGAARYESCAIDVDFDGDGAKACADLDCWTSCTPWCPPGASCDLALARCGDGTCSPNESCRTCSDCACTPACGDLFCDPGEASTCPGDCP